MKRTLSVFLCLSLLFGCLMTVSCGPTEESSVQTGLDPNKKMIAFTFDDGPHAPAEDLEEGFYPYTTYILDKLEATGARASFFMLGSRAKSYPAAVRRAVSLGCDVGCHTYDHETSYRGLDNEDIRADLEKTAAAIASTGVKSPVLFRPLGGSINESQLEFIASLGFSTIGWSIDTLDYEGRPKTGDKFSDDPARVEKYNAFVEEKVELIVSQAHDGAIVLMHDIYMSSVDIFIAAADRLIAEGYQLVTVSELLSLSGDARPVMHLSKGQTITYMP